MAKSIEKMSLEELETAITAKRQELESRRSELQDELSSIDSVLQSMGGGAVAAPAKRKPGRPKGSGAAKASGSQKGRRGPRAKNDMSMKEAIRKVLAGKSAGLTLDEITAGVQEIGYKSNSANFKNVVYQNLYGNKEMFPKNDDGKYTVAG